MRGWIGVLTNAVITIFNKSPDKDSRSFVYMPHVIERAWFHTDQKSSAGEDGLNSADVYQIRIPYEQCADWIPANDFKDLSSPQNSWTIQNGDFFLVGRWEAGAVKGIEEIRKQFQGIVGMILSHSENFFGTSRHIRIGGGS